MYKVVKRYDHSLGLSACFRQKDAASHCHHFHGYALAFEFEFHSDTLNQNNWVIDFGDLDPLKQWLKATFDHTTLIARDDPVLPLLHQLEEQDAVRLVLVDFTGCEAFARMAFVEAEAVVKQYNARTGSFARLHEVRVWEHNGNMAARQAELRRIPSFTL